MKMDYLEITDQEKFTELVQLWNESCSKERSLNLLPETLRNSHLHLLRNLMSMVNLTIDKLEAEHAQLSANQSKPCEECPLLRDKLLRRDEQLFNAREESRDLSVKLRSQKENFNRSLEDEKSLVTRNPKSKPVRLVEIRPDKVNKTELVITKGDIKKHFKQTTILKSFSNAKNRAPVETVDLTTLQGFDGGERSNTASKTKTNSRLKLKRSSNTSGALIFESSVIVETKQLKMKPILDPDESFFNPEELFASTPTKSPVKNLPGPPIAEFGNATLEIIQNFDKIPNAGPASPTFAYKPEKATRKKDERVKLPGRDCDLCRKYYEALQSQLSEEEIKKLKNSCSRHRSKYQANLDGTPPNYWDIDFPSTQECIDIGFMGQGKQSPRLKKLKYP